MVQPLNESDADARISRTRRQVLAATRELVAEAGAASVTHVRVAERSGVGRTTLYRHWPDVASLIIDALTAEPMDFAAIPSGGDPRDRLIGAMSFLAGRLQSDAAPMMLTLIERSENDSRYRTLLSGFVGDGVARFASALTEAGVAPDKTEMVALQLLGWMFACRFLVDRALTTEMIEERVDDVLSSARSIPSGR
jgi:AcrR family transcriptional regulator